MNERIKELAEQATRRYDRLGCEIPFAQPDLELFATLIIGECIDVIAACDENPKMILHEPYRTIINRVGDHFSELKNDT